MVSSIYGRYVQLFSKEKSVWFVYVTLAHQ